MTAAVRAPGIVLAGVVLSAVLPVTVPAQTPVLDDVDRLVNAGDYEAARATLGQWWSARSGTGTGGSEIARAHLLRATLAPDPAAAEADYLAVVLGYPASEHAPEALLRLGQGLMATGDATRAAAYLARLADDYPGQPQRLHGLLWLARANTAARRPAAACDAARRGIRDARDPDLAAMLRVEAGAACVIEGVAAAATPTPETRPAGGHDRGTTSAAPADPPRVDVPRAETTAGGWSAQTGAFRQRAGADALAVRLREAGFSPRLVRVPRNDLLRVRVGRFATSAEAGALVSRLRERGFDAVVVGDAAQEREP